MTLFDGDPLISPLGQFPGTSVNHIKVSPAGRRVLLAGSNGSQGIAALFSTQGEMIGTFGNQMAPVFTANYSGDGRKIVTASYDGSVSQWSAEGDPISNYKLEKAALCDAEYLPGGGLLVSSDNGSTSLWSSKGKLRKDYMSDGTARAVTVAPNGKLLASASDNGEVHLFAERGRYLRTFQTGGARINSLRFSENGKELLISTYSGQAKVFSVSGKPRVAIKATPGGITNQATYIPGTERIATAGSDGLVRFWSRAGDPLMSVTMPGSGQGVGVESIAFLPDGEQLFVAMTDRAIWQLS